MVASSVNTPSAPGVLKSVSVLRNVADLTELSPVADRCDNAMAVRVPPRHTDSVFTCSARVISLTTRMASTGPWNR